MAQIKGQEVSVTINQDGVPLGRITEITEFEAEDMYEEIEEGYLSESGDRYDSVWKGMRFSLKAHMSNLQLLDLADAVRRRSQGRSGGATRIDIVGTFLFPEGMTATLALKGVQFANIPVSVSGRKEYVSVSLEGRTSEVVYLRR